jgi:ABC-type glycerol-3-phosphate transport system permease component
MQQRTLNKVISAAAYAALLIYALSIVYPMFWLLYTPLKEDSRIFLDPFALPDLSNLQWANFIRAWTDSRFSGYFANSAVITVATVMLTTLFSAMAAYALSRFAFRGARPLLFYFLAGMMIPLQLAIVPLFFQMKQMDLLNSRLGLLLVYVANGLPFGIFVLTGFFRSLPSSLHEAALIDGAAEWRAFWSVMLPVARPGLITVAIFTFLGTWNEYFMAFMFLSGKGAEALRTLPLGMANLTLASQYQSNWGIAFAGLVLMLLPVLGIYILLQRHLVSGVSAGAVKG